MAEEDGEVCQRCREVGQDRRTLQMACFYDMDELGLPFTSRLVGDIHLYTLRVCKACRSRWLEAIQAWFHAGRTPKESPGTGIFVRRLGANVEVTEEEYRRLQAEGGAVPPRPRSVEADPADLMGWPTVKPAAEVTDEED